MKRHFFLILYALVLFIFSCKKDDFISGSNTFLLTSDTLLHFDTVFTTAGSVTKVLKLFNINSQKLRISNLRLEGGSNSFFKMNVSGLSGVAFQNIDILAGDSLYVFVSVTMPRDNRALPFLVEDSIGIIVNGNTQHIALNAYGQNAHFLRNKTILRDTTWTNDLPFVLLDSFSVASGAVLTIEKGVRVYCHADTPFYIAGSLHVNGGVAVADRVLFTGDRLDAPYNSQPGTWEGLYFLPGSSGNVLNNATIQHAKQGVAADALSRIWLHQCRIDNCTDAGIIANNSTLNAVNCLVSNCSSNVYLIGGGSYQFLHCTLAAFSTPFFSHQYPALFISNTYDNAINPLKAVFRNCIVAGDDDGLVQDEIMLQKSGTGTFDVTFENSLYKSGTTPPFAEFTNSLQSADPLFKAVEPEKNIFDFHLQSSSPCINSGLPLGIDTDLDGYKRDVQPDMGCYEAHL